MMTQQEKEDDLVTILSEMTQRIIELKQEQADLKSHLFDLYEHMQEQHEELDEHVMAIGAVVEVVAEETGLSPDAVAAKCRANAISASNPDYASSIPDNAAENPQVLPMIMFGEDCSNKNRSARQEWRHILTTSRK